MGWMLGDEVREADLESRETSFWEAFWVTLRALAFMGWGGG